MFRCWQRGLCSSSSTRDSPQGTAGPLSQVWGALMKIHSRKGTEHQKRRDQQRARENKVRERRGGRGREGEDALPWSRALPKGQRPMEHPHHSKGKQKQGAAEKLRHPDSNPWTTFASLKGPTVPCGGYKAGKRDVWSEAEAGKGGGMDSPKCFNVCLFCYPLIKYLCYSAIN